MSVALAELIEVAEGRKPSVGARVYGIPDGMKTTECSEHQPGALRARDGRLWFTTRSGLVIIDPARLGPGARIPPVRLEEVVTDQGSFGPTVYTLNLRPDNEDLQFHYTALSLLVPERIRLTIGHCFGAGTRRRVPGRRWSPPGPPTCPADACPVPSRLPRRRLTVTLRLLRGRLPPSREG